MSEDEDEREVSEFGRGLVVCLAKFSEHLWNWQAEAVMTAINWVQMTEQEREDKISEMRAYPFGDAVRRYGYAASMWKHRQEDPARFVSMQIELWANGASDHFYDLDESAPMPLKMLASLTLTMGHGFTGEIYGEEDWQNVRNLWEQSCLALDERLGVEHEWGLH